MGKVNPQQTGLRSRNSMGRYHGKATVAKLADAVYVRHAFQKKTQKTAKADIELAAKRYKLIGDTP